MIKRTFFLSLALMTGLATAVPNQAQNTQNSSIIQKLKEKYKTLKNKLNDFENDEILQEDLAFGSMAIAIISYLFERSIVLGHETSHCAAAWITLHLSYFYVNPQFFGGGYCAYTSSLLPESLSAISTIFIAAAGPIGGVLTYVAWLKIWNIFTQREQANNFKEYCIKGWKKPLFNKDSSLIATAIIFHAAKKHFSSNMFPIEFMRNNTYGSLSNTVSETDGLQIQKNLATICPALATMYPSLVRAGLVGLTGYGVYGIYKILKAKYEAYQKNENVIWC